MSREKERSVSIGELCELTGLSAAQLNRRFKARFGMTPHAFQINQRVNSGEGELRRGQSIADAALAAGFADQAHFQRMFKDHRATTPRHFASTRPRLQRSCSG